MNIDTSIFTMEKYKLKDIATVKISSVDKKKKRVKLISAFVTLQMSIIIGL